MLLAVYNICGLSGFQNTAYYVDAIRSLKSQTIARDLHVVISSCRSLEKTRAHLLEWFKDSVSYNWVENDVPLSITFNDTVQRCVEHFGPFEGYLYLDSGINFWDPSLRYDSLARFVDLWKSGPYAIAAAFPSNDDGASWWGIQYERGGDLTLPVNKATNMHCQIFSEDWRKAYGRVLPDIFGSNCMESVLCEMAAALKKNVLITQKVNPLHLCHLDGASMASRQGRDFYPMSPQFPAAGLLFCTKKSMDERYAEGREYGFGFEGCSPYWPHDLKKYDQNGHAKDERLLPFLKRELYLKPHEFDYASIKSEFIPRGTP